MNLLGKDGGYTDMEPVLDFYTLFRGIFDGFWKMIVQIAKVLGVDVDEGKTGYPDEG